MQSHSPPGDDDEFSYEEFLRRTWLRIRNTHRKWLGQSGDEDDLVGRISLKIVKLKASGKAIEDIERMMRKIIRHEILSELRRQKGKAEIPFEDAEDLANGDEEGETGFSELMQMVAELPELESAVFLLFFEQGMTRKEMAAYLGEREQKVKTALGRARRLLSARLLREYPDLGYLKGGERDE